MKKYVLMLLILCAGTGVLAQPPGGNRRGGPDGPGKPDRKEIEAQFIAFITKQLELTPEESQKFWPVYNKYQDEMKEIRKERRDMMREGRDGERTEKELDALMLKNFDFKEKEVNIERRYHGEFKAVLPIKKIGKLYIAEEEFKRHLLGKMRK